MNKLLKVVFPLLLAGVSAFPVLSGDLELTIVYDNNPYREGLETRGGFSCLVVGLECTLLFDVVVYMPKSFPQGVGRDVESAGAREVKVDTPVEICQNAYSTGELGSWIKEQSLVIRTAKGLVVITGCAHPGVVEIVQRAKQMLSTDVYLVLGGFHLCWMSNHQVRTIIKGMQRQEVEKIAPCHCSGDLAREQFEKYYGKDFILTGVGTRITIADAF